MGELYHALRAAGAPEEIIAETSEEIAAFENRLAGFENQITDLRGDMPLIKWMDLCWRFWW